MMVNRKTPYYRCESERHPGCQSACPKWAAQMAADAPNRTREKRERTIKGYMGAKAQESIDRSARYQRKFGRK